MIRLLTIELLTLSISPEYKSYSLALLGGKIQNLKNPAEYSARYLFDISYITVSNDKKTIWLSLLFLPYMKIELKGD